MENTQVANKLNELMGKRNGVEIYCNGFNDLVVRGGLKGVKQTVRELAYSGLKVIKLDSPDNTNPYDDGKYTAIVGK